MVALLETPPVTGAELTGVAEVAAAIDRLAACVVEEQPVACLGDDIRLLRRCIDRLEMECSRRLGRFASAQAHLSDDAGSVVAWLRHECGLSGPAAAQRLEVARRLPELPTTWAAFCAGDIGFQNAALIARAATDIGPEGARAIDSTLAESAARLLPEQMRQVAAHARHCADPDGALDDANHQHERRRLHLSQTFGGMFVLDGLLDAEGGATLRTALEALIPPRRGGDPSPAQRRADALVELAARSFGAGRMPGGQGGRPHLTVTVPRATLEGRTGAPGAEMVWAGVVPAATARRLACDAAVTRVEVDPCGGALSVDRATRTVPASTRRALVLRDRHCRFPGCDRPADWCEGHHIVHWVDGGPTRLSNLVLLCRRHHRRVHEEGWGVTLGEDHVIVIAPPGSVGGRAAPP